MAKDKYSKDNVISESELITAKKLQAADKRIEELLRNRDNELELLNSQLTATTEKLQAADKRIEELLHRANNEYTENEEIQQLRGDIATLHQDLILERSNYAELQNKLNDMAKDKYSKDNDLELLKSELDIAKKLQTADKRIEELLYTHITSVDKMDKQAIFDSITDSKLLSFLMNKYNKYSSNDNLIEKENDHLSRILNLENIINENHANSTDNLSKMLNKLTEKYNVFTLSLKTNSKNEELKLKCKQIGSDLHKFIIAFHNKMKDLTPVTPNSNATFKKVSAKNNQKKITKNGNNVRMKTDLSTVPNRTILLRILFDLFCMKANCLKEMQEFSTHLSTNRLIRNDLIKSVQNIQSHMKDVSKGQKWVIWYFFNKEELLHLGSSKHLFQFFENNS